MKRIGALALMGVLWACLGAFAQDTAQIVGTVTDSTGAVIPAAKITISNPDKGVTRELVTNSAGQYVASALPIGTYSVSAQATGFKRLEQKGISLQVGQIQRVDLSLSVGPVTQEVTVTTGATPVVQTETAAISGVITGNQIQNLNLNGRNFVTLALLVPGAVPTNDLNTTTVGVAGNNNISFNGSRTQYNNWEIDGGNNTDEGSASTFNTYPNLDTIAEFRISTSNYGADMGKHAGATIELATKSGTSTFHGDAFEYARRDWMDANDFFLNKAGAGKNPLSQHEYGYTLGGPVYIPGHYNTDKSKTFFFWSQDWRKILQGQVLNTYVPSKLQRQGDFSECDNRPGSNGNYNAIVANGCTLPTVGGITYNNIAAIPGTNPQDFANGTALLNGLVPLPNSGPIKYVAAAPSTTHWRQEQIRVDQNISEKTQAFVRYTQDAWSTLSVPSLWTGATYDTITTPFEGPGKSMVLHITHTFTPTLMNEFIMSYTTDHIVLGNQVGQSSVAKSIDRPSTFAMNHLFPGNDANTLLPAITVSEGVGTDLSSQSIYEDAGNHPWKNSNPIINWKDNLVWSRGSHTLKFGFFLQDYRKNEQFGTDTQGLLNFDEGSNSTGNALANLFLGRIASYQEGTLVVNGVPVGGYPKGHWVNHDFEPYIQDDWRVNSHLTLNLGLRYYFFTRIHDITKPTVDSGFLPNLYNPAAQAELDADGNLVQGTGALYTDFGNGLVQCGANGIPPGCQLRNTGKNFAPRFGFAWDPTGHGKTVIRGGYGLYYEIGNGNEAQTEGGEGNPPVSLSPTAYNITGYAAVQPVFDTATGQYNAPIPPTGYTAIPYDQKWGSEQQFNLNIQHQFAGDNLLTVGYVGMLGRHLARNRNISQIPPGVTTRNAPALHGIAGTYCGATDAAGNCVSGDVYGPSLNVISTGDLNQQLCDALGNCNVQTTLMFNEQASTFFQNFRGYDGMQIKENEANSSYNAFQISFRHPFGHGLLVDTSYTWSHNIDDSTSTYHSTYQVNDYNLRRWRATSDLNRTHVLQINYVYDLPFFKTSSNGFLKQALGGWTLSGISSFFSGVPDDGPGQCGISGFSNGIGGDVRCDSVGPLKIKKGVAADGTPTWYDPSVLVQPTFTQLLANNQPGMFGTMGRNVLTGPGRNNTDLALLKNFSLPWVRNEHSTLQLRLETFNTFNHTQFNSIKTGCDGSMTTTPPDANGISYDIPAFGKSCAGGDTGQVNGAWSPRVMQFGLKFIF